MTQSAPSQARVSLPRRLVRTTLVGLLVLLPVVGVCASLALRTPAWWSPIPRTDGAAAERGAQVEQALVSAFTRVRADAPEWSIRIEQRDANAWLATRLPAWLESRGLPQAGPVQALMGPGWMRVGVELPQAIVWWQASPIAQAGGWKLDGLRMGAGRLPLPGFGLMAPRGIEQASLEGPIRLADGRQVRVLDLEVLPGEVRLRLRTEPAQASGR
jgi:hypothetical protein